jgi:hypothetical protein
MPRWGLIVAAFIMSMSALMANIRPAFAEAQVLNPLFVQARGLYEEVLDSTLNAGVKTSFRTRFSSLESEQQSLWQMAGQVDAGQCKDSCINLYNSRVQIWQSQLQQFNADAARWLALVRNQQNPAQCLSGCDTRHSACWAKCLNGPIENNRTCHDDCNTIKDRCVKDCYGINQ